MNTEKTGLVLEGGGMRGLYTIGVLDVLMENDITFPYCIGVSAGACNAVSFISNQKGRAKRVMMDYISDKRYLSLSNFLKERSVFGMEFIFNTIPHELDLFDYDTFLKSDCEFKAGVTDVLTGKPAYFGKDHMVYDSTVLRASSSIPMFSPMVEIEGRKYLDGGTSDPIPVKKALEDGCDKVLVVLTRDRGYVKSPEKLKGLYHRMFKKYPAMIDLLDNRHNIYNQTKEFLFDLEKQNKAVVVAPSEPLKIDRFEKDPQKLEEVYQLGRKDMLNVLNKLGV